MANFTTEVRTICETLGSGTTIAEQIASSAPKIFDDSWTTADPEYKSTLENKILRHYYMREIGAETVGLWKLQLNTLLSEIMPKYNAIYENIELYKNNLMGNVNVTESQDLTNNQQTTAESNNTDNTTNSTKQTGTNTSSSSNKSGTNGDAWQEYNDTPQGGLSGLESQRYLTNATHNRSESDSTGENSATASTESASGSESSSTGHAATTGSSDTTENYVRKIIGKNSGTDFIDVYTKLLKSYNDVDEMIISDCNICFMGLWE